MDSLQPQSIQSTEAVVKVDLIIIFCVACIIRAVFFSFSVNQLGYDGFWVLSPDTQNYLNIARDFINGTNLADRYLYSFGPGFPAFLAIPLFLFGDAVTPIIVIQIVLSALSCCLIYILMARLSLSRSSRLLASIFLALSSTSISLCCVILSDTLFFFLLLFGLVLFLRGFENRSWVTFLTSGTLIGSAALVRAIGQFWWVSLLLVSVGYYVIDKKLPKERRFCFDRSLCARILVCVSVILAFEGAWMMVNQERHGVFALTSGASGGLANVAAFAVERMEGTPYREVRAKWHQQISAGEGPLTPGAVHDVDVRETKRMMSQYPWQVFVAYLSLTWENVNASNHLNRLLLPLSKSAVVQWEYLQRDHYLNYLAFAISLVGLVLLVATGDYRSALVLGLTFGYFVATIGVTRWQGSRLFFPGQIATTALAAVCLSWVGGKAILLPGWLRLRLGSGSSCKAGDSD